MKKIVKSLLVLVVVMLVVLVGCGKKDEGLKVGFIYIGVPGDEGFTYAHDQGRIQAEKLLKEKGIKVKTLVVENVADNNAEKTKSTAEDFIAQGCELIFATSFGYMDPILEVAKENPEVTFMHCSGYKTHENMGNYFGRIYQARYMTGYVAGLKFAELKKAGTLKAEELKVGYVAAFPIAEVVRGINAFTLGLKKACPEATVEVKYTETWFNLDIEYSTAKSLIAGGAHMIAQHQDTTKAQIAAQEAYAAGKNVYAIGYHSDMKAAAKDANLASAVWDFSGYYAKVMESVAKDTWKTESYWGGVKEGIVKAVLNEENKNLPAGAKEAMEKMSKEFVDGKVVFTGKLEVSSQSKDKEGVTETDGKYYYDCGTKVSDGYLAAKMDWYVLGVTVSE